MQNPVFDQTTDTHAFLPPLKEPVTVSIIMVVRNEAAHILECLARIGAQDYPHDRMELIIADGMSEDGTREKIASAVDHRIKTTVIDNPEILRPQGLNRAIKAARHDVILRIDARTIVERDYVSRCVQLLKETGAANVGGIQRPIATCPTQEAIGLAMSHPFGVGNAQFRLGRKSGFVDTVYLGCFRREVFDKIGYYDEESAIISEDSELNYRIVAAGGTIFLDAELSAYYLPRRRLTELWKQYFWYGAARAGSLIKHRSLTSWRQAVPPAFVLLIALSLMASLFVPWPLYTLTLAMAVYVAGSLTASASLAIKERRADLLPTLFLAFPCMHFSWALGFWRRLLVREAPGNYWPT